MPTTSSCSDFGLTAQHVSELRAQGYRPIDHYRGNDALREVVDLLSAGFFSRGDPHPFRPFVDALLNWDTYLALADYQSYADCQQKVSLAYSDPESWTRKSILSSARSNKFSSDRTIRDYCDNVWRVKPVPIRLLSQDEVKAGFLQ